MVVRRHTGRVVAVLAAASLVGAAAVGCSSGGGADAGSDAAVSAFTVKSPPGAAVLSGLPAAVVGSKIVVGDAKAPHTVTVYVDPRCPYCQKFEEGGATALADLAAAGKVKVEYQIASFLDGKLGGSGSVKAANALRASVDGGKGMFARFQAALFASQPGEETDGFTDANLLKLADSVPGLRTPAFEKAVKDTTHRDFVARSEKDFEAKASGTPTVLLDGKQVKDGALYERAAFTAALKAAGIG
ncbi:DsbA family protein [Streptomyces beijiangensis]|uniref:Thioredoxin domain-containing protein n=1 Tax=Streptomyces beijiangensis TaxID=163361 RepID=A0A939FCC1_9ACTN|nr:thioredoxin domain-containing protein [Streptomyces beijiangensis]MBO0514440.1 thioredoxin domain-containing protein [Streptomyces beijiangensis]